ncbi:MAG: inositol monophosphatase [Gammaproteobacteria bacterium]|nr:inositol monophosphatase [Gammaproteobacteria bacterium]
MHPMLNIAVRAARRAGTIIVRGQARLYEVKVSKKGPQDYVTQVDKDAEAAIIDTLRTAYPDHAVLAEESGGSGESDYEWIIDPLDGTLNFMHGYPQYAVSIALAVKGRVEQGVVYDPLRDELFTATRGAGAQLNGHRLRVSRTPHLEDALLATGFPVRRKAEVKPFVASFGAVLERCADVRRAGAAALDLAHVACGRLDGYWEFGLKPWDIAAGGLIVQEAGGLIGDADGSENHLERGDIVAANPKIFRQLLVILARREGGRSAVVDAR